MSYPISSHAPYQGQDDPLITSQAHASSPTKATPTYLSTDTPSACHLPGSPRISLDCDTVEGHAESELVTPDLDQYQSLNLLWLVSTPSRRHVSSLTHQIVRGRQLVITEQARLHCVWINDRVFLKPIPRWLLSATFWRNYLEAPAAGNSTRRDRIVRAAKGFLATYALLVTHESDFELAREKRLVPNNLAWEDFCMFVAVFDDIADDNVSPRYSYGDLRLSRLNLLAPLALGKLNYQKVHGQYTSYFATIFAPLIFVIGFWSLLLNAMQTGLAALDMQITSRAEWELFQAVVLWFCVATIITFLAAGILLLAIFLGRLLNELRYALASLWRRSRKVDP